MYQVNDSEIAFNVSDPDSSSLAGTVVSLVIMAIFEDETMPASAVCGLLLLGHALGAGGGAALFQLSAQLLSPVVNSPILTT